MRIYKRREGHQNDREGSEVTGLLPHGGDLSRPVQSPVQPALTIGRPSDRFEREADRVADQVTQSSSIEQYGPLMISQAPSPSRGLSGSIPRRENDSIEFDGVPEIVHGVFRSSGQPLAQDVRARLEPRFGHDFSQVRIHSDGQAAESATAISARAFTLGNDIVFGAGEYSPRTSPGQRLLAHELAHVVQQSADNTLATTVIRRENGSTAVGEPPTETVSPEVQPLSWQEDNAIQDYVEDSAEEWRHNKDRFDRALRNFRNTMTMTSEDEVVPDVTGALMKHVTEQITGYALSRVETLLPGWSEVKGAMDAMIDELDRAAAAQSGLQLRDFLRTTDRIMSENFETQIRSVRNGRDELREMLTSISEPEIRQGFVDSFPSWLEAIRSRVPPAEAYEAAMYIGWVNQSRGMLDGFIALGRIDIKFNADTPGKYELQSAIVRSPMSKKVASGLSMVMRTPELGMPNILYLPLRKAVGLWCENIVGGKGYSWALMDENNNTTQLPLAPVARQRWRVMPWAPLQKVTEVSGY